MDGEAWRTMVHGVAKSWTWQSDLTELKLQLKKNSKKERVENYSPGARRRQTEIGRDW